MQKYNFFYNKAALNFIITGEKCAKVSDTVNNHCYESPSAFRSVMDAFLHGQQSFNVYVNENQSEEAFKDLLSYFRVERAAGGVVQRGNGDFLMIKRFGFCDFPKGHVEAGETFPQTALREVTEETGVGELEILRSLPTTYHIFTHGSEFVLKSTHWYLMRTSFNGALQAQTEEQIVEARWVSGEELPYLYPQFYPSLQLLMDEGGFLR